MATAVVSASLQRTNSNGQLNIYLLIENKINDDLIIICRNNLPPALRSGKLILHQKITIRDEERRSIEGTIIYMHHNRENCLIMKKDLLEKRKQQQNGNKSLDASNLDDSFTCASQIIVGNKISQTVAKKPLSIQQKVTTSRFNKNSTLVSSTPFLHDLCEGDDDDEDDDLTIGSIEYSLSSVARKPNQEDETNTNLDDTVETSCTIEPNYNISICLEKIKELSLKVKQQASVIKQKTAEIQRLHLTTMEIPKDQVVQDYIMYLGDKVRQQTTAYKYRGSLSNDATNLGINIDQLNGILKSTHGITSIARDLFQKIVPENRRQVDSWALLEPDVLLKETILIEFMERYYGPLKVDQKKLHCSLVSCLRNQRNVRKKGAQTCLPNNDEEANNTDNMDQTADQGGFDTD